LIGGVLLARAVNDPEIGAQIAEAVEEIAISIQQDL